MGKDGSLPELGGAFGASGAGSGAGRSSPALCRLRDSAGRQGCWVTYGRVWEVGQRDDERDAGQYYIPGC